MSIHRLGRALLAVALLVGLGLAAAPAHSASARPGSSFIVHKVSQGQNLWLIAQRYGVTVKELVAWNTLSKPDTLYPGQALLVRPAAGSTFGRLGRFSAGEMDLLARVIYAEARGEDFEGQVAVGAVVLNRLEDPDFPKSLYEVVYQPGAFSAVQDRQVRLKPDEAAREAAAAAVSGEDPTGGALFYYNPAIARDRWIKTRPVLKVIGNHTFAT